jgi:hypothetical protein
MNKTVVDHSIQICILHRIVARYFFPLIKLEEKEFLKESDIEVII